MGKELNIDRSYIYNVSKRSNKYYKTFEIEKKNGDKRIINHPSPILKTFQYWLVNRIFNHLPTTKFATAYKKGCSIKKNALLHLNKSHILRLDILKFFPSISVFHIEKLFKDNQLAIKDTIGLTLEQNDISIVSNLVLLDGHLTIGSVSSPSISNCIMFNTDNQLEEIATYYSCCYSRYADDMVFSSKKYIPDKIISEIEKVLLVENFQLNKDKTLFMSSKGKKFITGINVNNSRLTLGRKKRDEIKKMVYLKISKGIGDDDKIRGYLNYVRDIDPYYFSKIINKYGDYYNLLKNTKEI